MTAINLLSGSIILIVIGWGAILLVLWNLYRHAGAFSKRGLAMAALVASALAMAGVFILLRQSLQRIPQHKLLVIFPFLEKTPRGLAVTPQGLSLAEQLTAQLQRNAPTEMYPLPVAAIFEIANPDSMHVPEYLFRTAKSAGVHILGLGVYRMRGNDIEAQFQLFRDEETASVLQHTFSPSPEAFAELRRGIFKTLDLENAGAPSMTANAVPEEYAALSLRFLRHEDVAAEAAALASQDSTNAAFATLSAQATLRALHERRAHETEWNSALKVLIPQLQRAARYDSLGVEPLLLLAQCDLRQKKWNEAEKHLRRARALEARQSKSYVYFAQLHSSRFVKDGFENELELFQYALQLNPFDIDAVLGAVEYFRMNLRKPEALALLTQYLRMNPDQLALLRTLGRFYVMDNDMPQALEVYEHIIRLDPRDANAFYNLGIAYYYRKDVDRAVQFFERAIQLNDHADARLYLAYIAEQRGDIEQSLAYLRERIRRSTGADDVFAAEARKQLYKKMLQRGALPKDLLPDTLQRK